MHAITHSGPCVSSIPFTKSPRVYFSGKHLTMLRCQIDGIFVTRVRQTAAASNTIGFEEAFTLHHRPSCRAVVVQDAALAEM